MRVNSLDVCSKWDWFGGLCVFYIFHQRTRWKELSNWDQTPVQVSCPDLCCLSHFSWKLSLNLPLEQECPSQGLHRQVCVCLIRGSVSTTQWSTAEPGKSTRNPCGSPALAPCSHPTLSSGQPPATLLHLLFSCNVKNVEGKAFPHGWRNTLRQEPRWIPGDKIKPLQFLYFSTYDSKTIAVRHAFKFR